MTNHEVRPMSTIYSSQATMVSDDPNHFKSSNFTHVLLENYMKSDHNQQRDTSNLKRRLPIIAFSTVVLYPFQCLRWLMFLILSVGVFIWNSYVFFLVILNGTEEFLRFRSLFAPHLQFVKPG